MAPSKSKAAASHPTYLEMIKDAILSLKERSGSSQYAIAKFIENKHRNQLPPNFKKLLLLQLKKIVASDKLVKVKNSYKLPPTRVAAAAKPVAAVVAKKPPVKSSAAPVASKPKAPAKPKSKAETTKPKAAGARSKLAAKPKTASKPKAKPVAKVARTSTRSSPGKKAPVKNMKKSPVKSVKKPKSVKSPAKKAPVRKANK